MHTSALKLLRCPHDGSELRLGTPVEGGEVHEGSLRCSQHDHVFSIRRGVPVMLEMSADLVHTSDSFGFEWDRFHRGRFESETVFGLTLEEDRQSFFEGLSISPEALDGAVVLDAGCGSGRLTIDLATQFPNATIVGLDLNPAIEHVFEKGRHLPNLHVVRGSIFDLPFEDEAFDFVWSNGVIHHTGDTRRAFRSLTTKTRAGGRLYAWVYERKPSPLVMIRDALARVGLNPWNWNRRVLYAFCWCISLPTWLAVKMLAPLRHHRRVDRTSRLGVLSRDRGMGELVLTWFDVLSPKYRDTYTVAELEAWFTETGFQTLARYWWPVGVSGTRR